MDILTRIYAQKLADRFGQQFVVDNRAGAGGSLAAEATVRAEPDGYTLCMSTNANTFGQSALKSLKFIPDTGHNRGQFRRVTIDKPLKLHQNSLRYGCPDTARAPAAPRSDSCNSPARCGPDPLCSGARHSAGDPCAHALPRSAP